jgi:uncharacterized lipoprotein YmbA
VKKLASFAAACALAAGAGCVSLKRSPEARYFVLRSVTQPSGPGAPAAGTGAAPGEPESLVGLLPVRVPEALARPELVSVAAPGELRVDPLQRWAEPLDEGATRTLAENLGLLLPGHRILRSPWRASAPLQARIAVDVSGFGPGADGVVRLDGSFVLLEPAAERALARQRFAFERRPAAPGGAGAVEAMSALLGDLARDLARSVEALPSAAKPRAGEASAGR